MMVDDDQWWPMVVKDGKWWAMMFHSWWRWIHGRVVANSWLARIESWLQGIVCGWTEMPSVRCLWTWAEHKWIGPVVACPAEQHLCWSFSNGKNARITRMVWSFSHPLPVKLCFPGLSKLHWICPWTRWCYCTFWYRVLKSCHGVRIARGDALSESVWLLCKIMAFRLRTL